MIEKTYNVGIYCRLSNDDERDGESVSIENQKLLLQSYVRQRAGTRSRCTVTTGTQVRISTDPASNASSKMQKPKKSTSFW